MSEHPRGPEILAENVLIQICVGEHQVIMHFDGEMSVSIEAEVRADPADTGQVGWLAPPTAGSALIAFLGRSVKDAHIDDHGDLVIAFESGRVQAQKRRDGYESFHITAPGVLLVY